MQVFISTDLVHVPKTYSKLQEDQILKSSTFPITRLYRIQFWEKYAF